MRKNSVRSHRQAAKGESGGALLAALILVVLSGIMGATILFATSTDLQISGNFRRAVQSLYAAEAGLAETQRRLAGLPATDPWYIGDPSPIPQANWAAYVLTNTHWQPQEDPGYSTLLTNYVPSNGDITNTLIHSNSLQSLLSYWTKIQHKTEYDAEQAGHSVGVPHYVDGDGLLIAHTKANKGQLIRFGYPDVSSTQPGQFSVSSPSLYPPVEIIRSQGEVEGAMAILQVDAAHQPGPPIWAPVYVRNHLGLLGGAITIQGQDSCGMLPGDRPPVSLGPLATILGTATLTGNPGIPQRGPDALDLSGHLDRLKRSGQRISGDLTGITMGIPGTPTVQVADYSGGLLRVTNVTGYGVLLVDGSLEIFPPFHWEGLILVTGQVTVQAGFSPVTIRGAVFMDSLQLLNNTITISLDTCPIAAALPLLPIRILNWRQIL